MVVSYASRFVLSAATPAGQSKSRALQLLLTHAYIHPVGRGLYSLLPLGQRVVDRLVRIIEQELDAIGAQKVSFPSLGAKELWDRTGRWESMGLEMMHVEDRLGNKLCLQPTAEEMCTQMVAQLPQLKNAAFPLMIYQTTDKFRDEMNPRFGLLRARQFLMNDLYSFDMSEEKARETYAAVSHAYDNIFGHRLALNYYKVRADSGVHGGKLSHEYHLANPLEEDGILYCSDCSTGWKADEPRPSSCSHPDPPSMSTVEVAHTFQLGTKYAHALKANYQGKNPLEMCCFGIGVSRVVAAAVEALSTETEIRLPEQIAPFDCAVVVSKKLLSSPVLPSLLSRLSSQWEHVLVDDRVGESVGRRIGDMQRIGIPRVVVLGRAAEEQIPRMEVHRSVCGVFEKRGELEEAALIEALA